MFFNEPGRPSNLKKAVYLLASTILGIILSFVVHALVEISYLRWTIGQGNVAVFYGGCALLPLFQTTLWLLGVVGGFFLGLFWWRKVYVEKKWVKNNRS